ncbi:MAG: hypothetical protein ACYTHK_13155 [Planctomycetota bacterium]|jgi:hypothetical protein
MHLLIALLLLAPEEEMVFEKEPVVCAAIEFEVRIPQGWKVAMDKTGISAQGDGAGFVITREPFLGSEDSFAEDWRVVLVNAGLKTRVEKARAGRYRAYHARWEKGGRVIDVYRLFVPDLQMLYNISFSTPKGAATDELFKGVFKSFKVTEKAKKLELTSTNISVGKAGTLRIPKGCEEQSRQYGPKSYVRMMKGYEKPKTAVTIRVTSVRSGISYRTQDDSGSTSDPEFLNRVQAAGLGFKDPNWIKKPKSKAASYGGLKGLALTGQIRGADGDVYEACLWSGKGKRESPTILIIVHERETKLYKNYIKTILKSFKAAK